VPEFALEGYMRKAVYDPDADEVIEPPQVDDTNKVSKAGDTMTGALVVENTLTTRTVSPQLRVEGRYDTTYATMNLDAATGYMSGLRFLEDGVGKAYMFYDPAKPAFVFYYKDVLPEADNARRLGSSTYRWANIHTVLLNDWNPNAHASRHEPGGADALTGFVNKAGDTMTGSLTVQATAPQIVIDGVPNATYGMLDIKGASGYLAEVRFWHAGVFQCYLGYHPTLDSLALYAKDFLPLPDNVRSLGSASYRWSNLYAVTTTIGDLILEGKDAKWRISEKQDGLYAEDLKTGKKYKLKMEEVKE